MRRSLMKGNFPALCFCLLVMLTQTALASDAPLPQAEPGVAPPEPLRMVMDVRSTHSDGKHTMEELARLAEARGIDVLAINEHDRFTVRLGIDPFPWLLGYSLQHPSLYETGVDAYFDDLASLRRQHPGMIFLAGTESTPGYHWSGIPFRNLTLHGAERHIITLGAERPGQITRLPSFDLRYAYGSRTVSLLFWGALALVLLAVLRRRRKHGAVLLLGIACAAVLVGWLLRKPVDADAAFLKAAGREGLFTAWAHPGTRSGVRAGPMGVQLDTPPYNKRVFESPTADAFAAVYGDTDSNCEPGGLWDRYMIDYLHGRHDKPIWGVAAGDFHAQGEANEYLGNYPMDIWPEAKTTKGVLTALASGRSVAWGMPRDRNIRMAELYILPVGGKPILPGGKPSDVPARLELVARLSESGDAVRQPAALRGQWVVDGRAALDVELPVNGEAVRLPVALPSGAHVVRLHIPMQRGIRMEANPFLIRVTP